MATGSKTAPGAGSTAAELPGIFRQLADEHTEVETRMQRVAGTIEIPIRQELFPGIRRSLLDHAQDEEAVFYACLQQHRELHDLVARSLEEHAEMEKLLNRLDVKDKSTRQWGDLFAELVQAVQHHVTREETELFPAARDLLGAEQAWRLAERYTEVAEARTGSDLP